jgi:hypothetical protein
LRDVGKPEALWRAPQAIPPSGKSRTPSRYLLRQGVRDAGDCPKKKKEEEERKKGTRKKEKRKIGDKEEREEEE